MLVVFALSAVSACSTAATDDRPSSRRSPAAGSSTTATRPGQNRAAAAQSTLDAVVAAVRVGDRPAFDAQLTTATSEFADRLFANLETLPPDVVLRAEQQTADLSPPAVTAAPGGWRQRVTVRSRLDHDTGASAYEVWFAMADGGDRVRLSGPAEGPDGATTGRPLWLIQRIRIVNGPDATVVSGSDRTDLPDWLRRAQSAERAVRVRTGKPAHPRWDHGLVVELPGSGAAFDRVLGVAPGSYDQIAAVAWPQGPDPATAAVRVVVNPDLAATLDEDRLDVLITHEATHVLTRSASSPAPNWLVEGFADWVAFDRIPGAAPPTEDLVLADVRRHGAPTAFPADNAFRPDASDLDLNYGRAWLLCRFIADTWSGADLVRLYAEIDAGATTARAFPDVLGVEEQALLRRWSAWLDRQADR